MSFFIEILLNISLIVKEKRIKLSELNKIINDHQNDNKQALELAFLESHDSFVTKEEISQLSNKIRKYFYTELEVIITEEIEHFSKRYTETLKDKAFKRNSDKERNILHNTALEFHLTVKPKILSFLLKNQKEICKRLPEGGSKSFPEILASNINNLWNDLYHNKLADYASEKISEAIKSAEVNFRAPRNILEVLSREAEPSFEEYTLFDFACDFGDERLVHRFISSGWNKLIPNEHHKTPEQIAQEKGFEEIQKILEKEKPKIYTEIKRKVFAMVKTMKADKKSPVKKLTVLSNNQVAYENELEGHIDKNKFRPATVSNYDSNEAAITPGKTSIYQTWDLVINRDLETRQKVGIYLNDQKPEAEEPPNEEDQEEILQKFRESSISLKIPKNSKKSHGSKYVIKRTIHYDTYKKWQLLIAGGKSRYRDQAQVMGNISAEDAAKAAGFNVNFAGDWQWCHLIAYSLGGEDSIMPSINSEYDHKGPQRETNLVVGTREANAHMLIVEDMLKKLINSKEFPDLTILLETEFVEGLEDLHIAKTVTYTIQDHPEHPTKQITFSIDMLSRRKVAPEETEILPIIMKDLFSTSAQQLIPEEDDVKQQAEVINTIGHLHDKPVPPATSPYKSVPALFGSFARHKEEHKDVFHTLLTKTTAANPWDNFKSFEDHYRYSRNLQDRFSDFLSFIEHEDNLTILSDEQRCILLLNITLTFLQAKDTEDNKNFAAQAFSSASILWRTISNTFTMDAHMLQLFNKQKEDLKKFNDFLKDNLDAAKAFELLPGHQPHLHQ